MHTRHDDPEQNTVLWITPDVCCLPESPGGFALRVDDVLGPDHSDAGQQPRRIWVRGPVLLGTPGPVLRTLTLCVPVDQPPAVRADQAPAPDAPHPGPVEPVRAVGVAAMRGGAHRADGRVLVEHAGRLYRRVEVPAQ
jgi:hypothetical protein